MPKCQKQVKRGNVTRRCGNKAVDGHEFCKLHGRLFTDIVENESEPVVNNTIVANNIIVDTDIRDVEIEVENQEIKIEVEPKRVVVPDPIVLPGPSGDFDITVMLAQIMNTLSELKLSQPKRQARSSILIKRAKLLFYHDAKKDKAFVQYVASAHNITQLSKTPWQLIKEKSDQYWETVDEATHEKYKKLAASDL